MNEMVAEGLITLEQRFSPHDLKRKGVTDTREIGRTNSRQAASGRRVCWTFYDVLPATVEPGERVITLGKFLETQNSPLAG